MICNCGDETNTHKVTRNKEVIAEYEQCKICGRVEWLYGKEIMEEIDNK